MTAPGADEFVPQAYGSLSLPPQRTFAPLVHGGSFRPQETRHLDLSIDQDVASFVVSVSHFRQDVDDQLVTIFGVEPHDADRRPIWGTTRSPMPGASRRWAGE